MNRETAAMFIIALVFWGAIVAAIVVSFNAGWWPL